MNKQHSFCSVMCYTVLIWTLILLTLGNMGLTYCKNHLIDLNQCNTFRLSTYKINAIIRICIRRILRVKISIQRMRILTSFVTSLVAIAVAIYGRSHSHSSSRHLHLADSSDGDGGSSSSNIYCFDIVDIWQFWLSKIIALWQYSCVSLPSIGSHLTKHGTGH